VHAAPTIHQLQQWSMKRGMFRLTCSSGSDVRPGQSGNGHLEDQRDAVSDTRAYLSITRFCRRVSRWPTALARLRATRDKNADAGCRLWPYSRIGRRRSPWMQAGRRGAVLQLSNRICADASHGYSKQTVP